MQIQIQIKILHVTKVHLQFKGPLQLGGTQGRRGHGKNLQLDPTNMWSAVIVYS